MMGGIQLDRLIKRIGDTAQQCGADLLGFADLQPVMPAVTEQGGEYLARFTHAVSLGIRLVDTVIDEIVDTENKAKVLTYHAHIYNVNDMLNRAAIAVAKDIERGGFKAYPVPASQAIDRGNWQALISHKLVARQAGLGWIGRNCLLITPGFGPRVRLATVLTDAPLPASQPLENGCGECRLCVAICPSHAIRGPLFSENEGREVRLDPATCAAYSDRRKEQFGVNVSGTVCGLCAYVCPHGRK